MVPRPHFLLFCDGQSPKVATAKESAAVGGVSTSVRGRWRFILEDLEAGTRLEACDAELVQAPERAALLAVVRGLEALEQPSRVTLVTTSRYVSRGLQFGLSEWRDSDYCWEHFGSVQPIRNADLWRRIDHALQFHQINCQWIAGQTTEDGEEMTQLQSEPIRTASLEPVAPSATKPLVQDPKPSTQTPFGDDNIDPVLENESDFRSSRWGRLGWRWLGAPVRSLRLPSLSSVMTSMDRYGWIEKWSSRVFWVSKHARVRRLAI